ncbi:hypothetical protein [Streptomyces sp. NPDC059575]|uniref:hypothetical protein n=1 Tax=Streptomyces sp. NPDC059575 TaxID=3346872 RepID=UPI0036C71429
MTDARRPAKRYSAGEKRAVDGPGTGQRLGIAAALPVRLGRTALAPVGAAYRLVRGDA